jgi:PAS domain S-box-containing protein
MPGTPEPAPVRGAQRTGFRLSRAATLVLVAMTVGSLLLWLATQRIVADQEAEILEHRTDQVSNGFNNRITAVTATLAAMGNDIQVADDPEAVQRALEDGMRPALLSNVAVVDTTTGTPRVTAAAGGPVAGQQLSPEGADAVSRLAPDASLVTTDVQGSGANRRLGFAQGPPLAPPGQAIYGELPVQSFDKATARAVFGAPSDVDSVIYARDTPAPDAVLFSTTDDLPFEGQVSSRTIQAGASTWLLQTRPIEPLIDGVARLLPWLVLAVGLVSAALVTAVVEMAARRRDDALAFADDRAEETVSILDAAREAFVVVGDELRIERWSGQAERMFGWTAEEAIGLPIVDTFVPPERREEYSEALAVLPVVDHETAEGARRFEAKVMDRHGRRFPIEISLWRSPRNPARVNAILHDITDRRQAADDLRRAHRQALAASQLKSEFVATMSHEIRTPMNGVIGMTALLLNTPLDEEQREYAETVRTSAEALLTVVNDILDFSKIEAGRLELEAIDFEVRRSVDEVIDLLNEQARMKGLDLIAMCAPDVPVMVHGDPGRLRQILLNLAGNAVKFTDEGEVVVSCAVAGAGHETDALRLRFEVHDTGVGVDPEKLDGLFDSFTQADSSTTRRYGGTGLGLAIARQLTELMGGQIGATSTPGLGSTFWFTVEVTPVSPSGAAVAGAPPEPVAVAAGRSSEPAGAPVAGAHVLVAEDNPVNQRVAVRMLETLGCTVDVVADGEEAVRATREGDYAVVFMDCQMPGMDGFDATREIRRQEGLDRHTPIVAMTAAAMTADRDRTVEAGMDDFVAKPVRLTDLESALARWTVQRGGADPVGASPGVELIGPAPIDLAAVEELRALVSSDDGGLTGLAAEFSSGATEQLHTMRTATDRGDLDLVARTAHHLRTTTTIFGAVEATADAEVVERAARRGDRESVPRALARLEVSLDRATTEVTRLVGQPDG